MRPAFPLLALLPFLFSAVHAQQSHRPAPTGSPANSAAGHVWHMKQTSISATVANSQTNYQGGMQLAEVSLLAPEGWPVEVGVPDGFPPTDCAFNLGCIAVHVTSPDKHVDLLSLPSSATFWSTNRASLQQRAAYTQQWRGSMTCAIEQPKTLQGFVDEKLSRVVPGAQVTGTFEPVPGLSAELSTSTAQVNLQLAPRGSYRGRGRPTPLLRARPRRHAARRPPRPHARPPL